MKMVPPSVQPVSSWPARWVLRHARHYQGAVDARGLGAVLVRLHRQVVAVRLAAIVLATMGLVVALRLLTHVAPMEWVLGVPVALVVLARHHTAGRWVHKTGWARLREGFACQLRAAPAVDSLTADHPVWRRPRLWSAQVVYLLAHPQGQAWMAHRALSSALDAPASTHEPTPRTRL